MPNDKQTNNLKEFNPSFLGSQNVILILAGFLVGLVVGIGAAYIFGASTKQAPVSQEHEALKAAVREEYSEYFDEESFETFYSGTVEEVKDSSMVVKVDIPEIVLLASDLKETREIKIDAGTQITKEIQKDPEQYNRELVEYEAAYAEYEEQLNNLPEEETIDTTFGIEEPRYPSATEQRNINLDEIEPGQIISVNIHRNETLAEDEEGAEGDITISTVIRVEQDFIEDMFEEGDI